MEPRKDLGLLPIPEHRRRWIRPLLILGVILVVVGRVMDIGFVLGLGLGLVITSLIVRLLDWNARRSAQS